MIRTLIRLRTPKVWSAIPVAFAAVSSALMKQALVPVKAEGSVGEPI
jgi:hypothetical protein